MVQRDKYKLFASRVITWEKENGRDFPWRHDRTPFKVFIAEVLLKRTTSTAAQRVYSQFLAKYPSISEIAQADIEEIEGLIRPIGLYRQRAVGVLQAAQFIVGELDGVLPDSWDGLLSVPHIGTYTAGCILSFGYGTRAPAVDSNVERVLKRCFAGELGERPRHKKLLELSWKTVPENGHETYNYGMIDLGSQVCTYRGCNAEKCPLSEICQYHKN